MSACGETAAKGFRAEIRLASDTVPDCSNVFYVPVQHLESEVLKSDWNAFFGNMACVKVYYNIVGQYCGDGCYLTEDTKIPFNCLVHKKVFVTLNKAHIDEKEDKDYDDVDSQKAEEEVPEDNNKPMYTSSDFSSDSYVEDPDNKSLDSNESI